MKGKIVPAIMLTLLLTGMLTLAFNVQPAKASGIIYIRADGSIDPPTAPISTADNVTYTLTDNINDSILVERDNIVVDGAGYTVTGSGSGNGTTLTGRSNVTVGNMTIKNFNFGIRLYYSSNNIVSGNNVTANNYGIRLESSSNNNVLSGNNVTANNYGIRLESSSNNNVLSGNNVTANNWDGIYLGSSSNNVLSGNNVTANNGGGIFLGSSSNNTLSGNNATNNGWGIRLGFSSNNTLSGNVMGGNGYNFGVEGPALSDYLQLVDTSNLVDGKPVYYFMNQSDIVVNADVYPQVGYLGFVNCANVTVQGLNLTSNYEGLLLAFTNNSKITSNNIANNEYGILLYHSSNNTLSGNNATNNWDGILLDSSSNNIVSGNNVTANNGVGILLGYSSNSNVLSGNNVANNAYGIELDYSSNNTLSGNNVTANNWDGIRLGFSSNNTLSGNNVANNSYGIYIYYSSNNTLSGNNVTANNWYGIRLDSSGNNVFYHNNFINNTQHVYVVTLGFANSWDDGYPSGGNYWSDYDGVDFCSGSYQNESGSDGMGDTPYVIDEDNQDNYPLMKPYPWDPHDVGITSVTTSKTIVGQGFNVFINASVFNYGDSTENINVTIYANSTAIGEINNIELASRNSTTIAFTWNTSGFARAYVISINATPVEGETDLSDNTLVYGILKVSCLGDLNGDYVADGQDYQLVKNAIPSMPELPKWNPNADLNDDGVVDGQDFQIVKNNIGQSAP